MKLYDSGIILGGVIAFMIYGIGYIINGKINEQPEVDYQEQRILGEGYVKTNYTEDQIFYSDYQECVEYKDHFYCY